MPTYRWAGDVVEAEAFRYAVDELARRRARRDFGCLGVVPYVRCDSHSEDGTRQEWQAFIGARDCRGAVTGHMVPMRVRRVAD